MQIQLEDLLDPFKSEDLLCLLCIGVLETLVGHLDQGLQDGGEILIVIGWTLSEEGFHAGVEDLDVCLPLGLEVLPTQFVPVVVEGVVFKGTPKGDPAAGAEQIWVKECLLPRQLAVLRIILLICTWRWPSPF